MKIDNKIIHSTENLDVVNSLCDEVSHDSISIIHNVEAVAVLPYTKINDNIIDQIGIIAEFKPFRKNKDSIIVGFENDDDYNSLDTAIRLLYEKTGYDITDESKWIFLKGLYTDNSVNSLYTCYAVDVTDNISKPANSDNDFKLVPINKIFMGNDSLAISLLLKLYINMYGDVFKVKQD